MPFGVCCLFQSDQRIIGLPCLFVGIWIGLSTKLAPQCRTTHHESRIHRFPLGSTLRPFVLHRTPQHSEYSEMDNNCGCHWNIGVAYLGIRLNFEPAIAKMAFTTKWVDGRRKVIADFHLLRIVAHPHTNMIVACSTVNRKIQPSKLGESFYTYHHMLKGSSKRTIRMPLSSFRARSPNACLPECHDEGKLRH